MRVTGRRVGEVVEIVAELRAADGGLLDASAATVQVTPPLPTATRIGPEGGVVSLEDGRVTLSFAPGAVAADVTVLARALGRPENAPANIARAYEFSVKGANGEDIHTFAQPLTLAVRHPEGQPEAGRLFVLEEATGEWQMLATQWDVEQGALVAEVPHLSQTAEGNNFVPEVMPSLRGVQSDLFSGGASYDYPIAAPPGTGGLTPQVGLQFSSRSRWEDLGHASVTGAGWKLTGDSFRYWRPWDTANGSAPTMRVEGAAFSEISGANGERTFKEAPQWRVVGDPTSATTTDVYGPNGVRYHFEAALHDWYCQGTTWQQRTDKWVLQYIIDQAGNRIDYSYDTALPVDATDVNSNYPAYGDRVRTVRIASACSAGGNQDIRYLSQINLTRISYNSLNGVDQSVIDFSYAITRTDSALANANDTSSWAHATTRLLTGIAVKQAGALVASYKLDYDFFDKPPGGGDNERLYALRSIRRCSDAGMSNCLPATLFSNTRSQMRRIDNGYGGQVGLGYGLDSIVVSRTITDTVTGSAQTWTYTYANRLDGQGGSLVGYRSVTETLPSSLGTGNWSYHHFKDGGGGDEFVGKEDQVTVAANNIKQAETLRTWVSTSNGVYGGGKFVYVSAETQNTYDKDGANPLARKTEYFYDLDHQGNAQYGNLTRIKEYSDSGATLYRTSERWYNPQVDMAAGRYIVDRLAEEKLWTQTSFCMSQARWIYDVAAPGFDQQLAAFAKGWLKEQWQAKICGSGAASDWLRPAAYGYDSKGNVNSVTAANGTATTTVYDATFSVYPLSVTVTPAAGLGGATLTTSYAYYGINAEAGGSGLTGQVQKATDPNGAVTRTSYDAFGRPLELRRPGAGFGNPATAKIAYTDAIPFRVEQSQRDDANGDANANATYLESYSFYDGLGQVLQTQAEGESAGAPVFASSQYNALGAVIGQSVPYTGTVLGTYAAFNWASPPQPVTLIEYDGLGRVTKTTLPDSSTVNTVYNGRKTASLNALGRQSLSEVDAFGRLVFSRQYTGSYVKNPPTPGWSDPAYATASYVYNERDQLESVSGPDGAATDPTYNLLGQKTQMVDPDLGTWEYRYDAMGNLFKQRDARKQAICFYYDGHNRLKGKTYHSNIDDLEALTCSGAYAVSFYYDDTASGNKGLGRRTGFVVYSGGAVSNTAAWVYDQRGRVTSETRKVEAAGVLQATTSSWAYDSADRVTAMTYPDGESVSTSYTDQGLPRTLGGYVSNTTYDVAGRALVRTLGANLRSESVYYAWGAANGQGRLKQTKAGTVSSPTTLLMLSYTYDAVGNVKTIIDGNNASQQQCFSYDGLNRLAQGYTGNAGCTTYAGAGNGPFEEQYTYFANGNLDHKKVVQPTYQDDLYLYDAPVSGCATGTLATKPHAVRQAGSNTYSYDCNGNMVTRSGQSLAYDAENHLISVSGSAVASFVYDGDGLRVKSTFGSGDSASIAGFSGKHFEVNSVYRESFDDLAAQNWQVITGTWQLLDGGYRQSNTTHTNTFTYYNLVQNQPQVVQWKATYTSGTQAGLYFYASAAAASDAERGNSYRVWQDASYVYIYEAVNNSAGTYKMRFNAANAAGQTHSYQATYNPQNGKIQVWRDGGYLGSWTDSTPLTTGNYLSLRTTTSNVLFDEVMVGKVKKYYYQGGARACPEPCRRVAMRDGTSVYYLFGDHLGSTNVTTDNGSALVARLLYKPFGQVRYNTNNQKTDYRYTGQWWASGGGATLGLYDYGARWYDPSLARFIQADTIVPEPGNPQSLNRYSYVLNNALKYTDPTGHSNCLECVGGGAGGGGFITIGAKVAESDGLRQALTVAMDWLQRLIGPAAMMAQNADKLPAARDVGNAGGGNTSPGGLDPNDPFRNVGESIRKGVETLRRQIDNPANAGYGRYGAQAHLSRAEHYMRQGTLQSVNATGEGSIDLLLSNSTGVEVKYWQAQTVIQDIGGLAKQFDSFNQMGLNKIIVEFVQTKDNPVTQAVLSELQQQLIARYGLDLSKFVFEIVANPGIP
ncbi:MAG: hypothetical protein K1X65_04755 [Caldilineales bacterium]|nr:hypothetical protein [Caldilineales bacterium]